MTDAQAVAIIAAILFAGDGIECRVADVSDALTHDVHDWSGLSFDEAVARARDLLALAHGGAESVDSLRAATPTEPHT